VVVVIDPARESGAQLIDEWLGDFHEAAARRLRGERHVEHHDAPFQVAGSRQLARRRECEVRTRHGGPCLVARRGALS
jgi:hypothetical protein